MLKAPREESAILYKHLANGMKGLLAAISADLGLIMVYGFVLQALGGPAEARDSWFYLKTLIIAPVAAGIPAGIAYGLYRHRLAQAKRKRLSFWLIFWLVSQTLFSGFILTTQGTQHQIVAGALGLLVFTGIWIFLTEVICDNPLSFDYLMPEESDDFSDTHIDKAANNSALIKKRRD